MANIKVLKDNREIKVLKDKREIAVFKICKEIQEYAIDLATEYKNKFPDILCNMDIKKLKLYWFPEYEYNLLGLCLFYDYPLYHICSSFETTFQKGTLNYVKKQMKTLIKKEFNKYIKKE